MAPIKIGNTAVKLPDNIAKVYVGSMLVYQKAATQTWQDIMVADYLSRNSHYSSTYATWAESVLRTILSPDYTDGETTGYYINTFGPSGQNKTVCDFLYLWKQDGASSSDSGYKTGATPRYNIGGSIYNSTGYPSHTPSGGTEYVVYSSTDGWSGLTRIYLDAKNLTGEIPKFTGANIIRFYLFSNTFEGKVPSMHLPSCYTFQVQNNNLTAIGDIDTDNSTTVFYFDINNISDVSEFDMSKCLTSDISYYDFFSNNITSVGIDHLLSKIEAYYQLNTPTGSGTFRMSSNEAPSAAGLADKASIESIFTAAGYTATVGVAS